MLTFPRAFATGKKKNGGICHGAEQNGLFGFAHG